MYKHVYPQLLNSACLSRYFWTLYYPLCFCFFMGVRDIFRLS